MVLLNSNDANFIPVVEALEQRDRATETVLSDTTLPSTGLAIFVDEESEISLVSSYHIGRRITTNRKIIELTNALYLKNPLKISKAVMRLRRYRKRLESATEDTGLQRITPALSRDLTRILIEYNPDLADWLRNIAHREMPSTYPAAGIEYDAISLPLKMIGLRRFSYQSENSSGRSVFAKMVAIEMTEDQILAHDYSVLADSKVWQNTDLQGKIFLSEDGSSHVEIVYANRTSLEKTLGVDLLIHNINQRAVILLQYKRMIKEGREYIYRIDDQFDREISRMNALLTHFQNSPSSRLRQDPFYLKFCPSNQVKALSTQLSLAKGITVPLEHFLEARENGRLSGIRGGTIITYDNMPRRLNNALFIDLAKKGWIGSDEQGTKCLTDLVSDLLNSGSSFIEARVFSQD